MWRVRLDSNADDLLDVLSADERDRAGKFYRREDQRAYVTSHAHLRRILGGYLSTQPESLQLTTNDLGKPLLTSPGSDLRLEFNLSHSGAFALIAVARGRRVGVDVERWKPSFDPAGVAGRHFSAAEAETLRAIGDDSAAVVTAFYAGWCRKEAYIKATGHGLARGLDHFDVTLDADEARLIADRLDHQAAHSWTMHALDVAPGYSAAVAIESRTTEVLLFDAP